jgi:hypothetical protein
VRPFAILTTAVLTAYQCGASSLGLAEEWRPDLIARAESDGGRNIPNFKYDGPGGHYTAGGVCQMTDTTWRRVAPTVDIDIEKFPNAGSASEHMQWQACWKLWSINGYSPWTCCNPKLRRALATSTAAMPSREPAPDVKRIDAAPSAAPTPTPYPFLSPGPTPGQLVFNVTGAQ